jgi:hypothetical protein
MPNPNRLRTAARSAFVAAALLTSVLVAAPAHGEKWVGYAYPSGAPVVKVILRGPTQYGGDGSVGFSGRFRCVGAGCPSRRGLTSVVWWNDAQGFGWQGVQIDLPAATCTSLAYFLTPWYTLPPPRGTTITVPYECVDLYGYLLGTGTVSVTRRR